MSYKNSIMNDLILENTQSEKPKSVTLQMRDQVPELISNAGDDAIKRFVEFFAAQIRNPNTRAAYVTSAKDFLGWCHQNGISDLVDIEPVHVAAWVELKLTEMAASSVKARLSGLSKLFDWLVTGQVFKINPAQSVQSPKHRVRVGKTPILVTEDARHFINSIETDTIIGLRDRALISVMTYGYVRISAALGMNVKDIYTKRHRLWMHIYEKGGLELDIPCHHNLEQYMREYLEAANLLDQPNGPLFRSMTPHGQMHEKRLKRQNAWDMVKRRAKKACIETPGICNHTFRGTGITAYLDNGGDIDNARYQAGHADSRTTKLYDRTAEEVSLDEVERIGI